MFDRGACLPQKGTVARFYFPPNLRVKRKMLCDLSAPVAGTTRVPTATRETLGQCLTCAAGSCKQAADLSDCLNMLGCQVRVRGLRVASYRGRGLAGAGRGSAQRGAMLRAVLRRRPSGGPGAYRWQRGSPGTAFRQVEREVRARACEAATICRWMGGGPVQQLGNKKCWRKARFSGSVLGMVPVLWRTSPSKGKEGT